MSQRCSPTTVPYCPRDLEFLHPRGRGICRCVDKSEFPISSVTKLCFRQTRPNTPYTSWSGRARHRLQSTAPVLPSRHPSSAPGLPPRWQEDLVLLNLYMSQRRLVRSVKNAVHLRLKLVFLPNIVIRFFFSFFDPSENVWG